MSDRTQLYVDPSGCVEPYDLRQPGPRQTELRQGAIEGHVETPQETVERKRREAAEKAEQISRKRKEHHRDCIDKQRRLDKARLNYRLSRMGLIASAVFAPFVVCGWGMAGMVGWASNFTGGRGGPLSFLIVLLVVITLADVIGIIGAIMATKNSHDDVVEKTNALSDALDTRGEFEIECDRGPVEGHRWLRGS